MECSSSGYRLPRRAPETAPPISVVIPYYENPDGLDEVLAGIAGNRYPGLLEVVIADDGSATPPQPDTGLDVTVVRQEDRGFRAAAARNLGARAARHEVLVFLDGDTVPGPGYLRRGDDTSWRFLISSVLTCSAALFREVGGFDAGMVGYGGEDWEFGWRCYNAGARFIHEPAAVATHREPDWGARHRADEGLSADGVAEKNAETTALAHRITHPLARPDGVVFAEADILVVVPDEVAAGCAPGALEALVAGWLAAGDVQVAVTSPPALVDADPRVGPDARGRVTVRLLAPVVPGAPPAGLVSRVEALGGRARVCARDRPVAEVTAPRHRPERAGAVVHVDWPVLDEPVRLERRFAGW